MTSPQYYRTPKGNQELENRCIKLSSRQRALLLMIENGHSSHLSQQQLRQLATPDNLTVLLAHQLIVAPDVAATHHHKPRSAPQIQHQNMPPVEPINPITAIQTPQHTDVASASTLRSKRHRQTDTDIPMPEIIPDLTGQEITLQEMVISTDLHSAAMLHSTPVYLSFDEVKHLMMNSLREYCGLLASALIKDIQHTSSITKLRMCQMRWVTTLTETRASPAQIAIWVDQINMSLAGSCDMPAHQQEALTL
ncbi:MAG: hypothetical protein EOO69_05310 [Moraxellaceae bacterium]|nr:MAG: hypothetical protein EOO69_05310 [Moraxellaceae bacterium]